MAALLAQVDAGKRNTGGCAPQDTRAVDGENQVSGGISCPGTGETALCSLFQFFGTVCDRKYLPPELVRRKRAAVNPERALLLPWP